MRKALLLSSLLRLSDFGVVTAWFHCATCSCVRWNRIYSPRPFSALELDFSSKNTMAIRASRLLRWANSEDSNYSEISYGDSFADDDRTTVQHYQTYLHDDDDDEELGDSAENNLESEFERWQSAVEKCIVDLEKRLQALERERKKADSVDAINQRAQLITSYMYMFSPGVKAATIQDWESGSEVVLELDSDYSSAAEEAAALFDKARKLKRGSERVSVLMEKTTNALSIISDIRNDLSFTISKAQFDEGLFRMIQDRLRRSSPETNFQEPAIKEEKIKRGNQYRDGRRPSIGSPASNIRKIFTPAGAMILIGRNRRGNEYLSMTKARPNDLWMHARGTPGAHILIPQSRGMPNPTEDCLQLAANLAAFYSDARNERSTPVTLTQAKHVLKPRGAPLGAVKLRQEDRVVDGVPSLVPDDLKEAREQSGQMAALKENAYRAADKAKRRRKTLATASKKAKRK